MAEPPHPVWLGSRGEDVQRLQSLLAQSGYAAGASGVFDARTYAAVVAFQRDHGMRVDGIVGRTMWNALLSHTPAGRHNEIYEHAATALAVGQLPDFSGYTKTAVAEAFTAAFDGLNVREDWLRWFSDRVRTLSDGKVTLEPADKSEFTTRVKGAAVYLHLIQGDQRRRLIIGPYAAPLITD